MEDRNVCGPVTHVGLGDMAPLTLPWTQDPFGALRPPLSLEAMRMSVELAGATYDMAVEPWLQAGWQDVTIQVDGSLTAGIGRETENHRAVSRLADAWRMHRVRARMRQRNPIGQVVGALRQIEKSDTGKVLVMCHPTADGRWVVAISFMGTGARFYDWFSNFRMASENGMHKGFLQLTRQFEDNEADITFPGTASALGVERLSLRQIIEEARNPNSRFILWLVGHSQGGALMQLYCHHKLVEDGVLPQHILGYGFASPSVMEGMAVAEPAAYPLYHIINSDDLVPRMGAQVHLGLMLIYRAGEDIRRQCYAWPRDERSVRNRMAVRPLLRRMRDTPSCIEMAIAYLQVLARRSPEDMLTGLNEPSERHPALRKMLAAADSRVDAVLRYLCRHLAAAYRSIAGEDIDRWRVGEMQAEIDAVVEQIGVKAFTTAFQQLMAYPHTCVGRKGALTGAYPYITLFGADQLVPAVWRPGRPPQLITVQDRETPAPVTADMAGLYNRRRQTAVRQTRAGRSYSQRRVRTDTRHRAATPHRGALEPGERMIGVRKA